MKDHCCPNCDRPSIGSTAILLITRGTHESLPGVACPCGNVWIDHDRPMDERPTVTNLEVDWGSDD